MYSDNSSDKILKETNGTEDNILTEEPSKQTPKEINSTLRNLDNRYCLLQLLPKH